MYAFVCECCVYYMCVLNVFCMCIIAVCVRVFCVHVCILFMVEQDPNSAPRRGSRMHDGSRKKGRREIEA